MKIKNAPRSLQNLPNGYHLDSGDYSDISKYRNEKAIKARRDSKEISNKYYLYLE